MLKSTGCTGRFLNLHKADELVVQAISEGLGNLGMVQTPGRRLSMSLISSNLPGMVAEEWNQKNPFLAIKVHHIAFEVYSKYLNVN